MTNLELRITNEELKINKVGAGFSILSSQFIICCATCAIAAGFFTGCSRRGTLSQGDFFFSGSPKNLSAVGTICLVELHNNTAYPQISSDVTDALYQTLQKKELSGIFLLRQNDVAWKNIQIRPDAPYTLEQLLATRKMLGADAIFTGAVTGYTPYPHMSMGLKLMLIDLRNGQTAWSAEMVWDTSDKTTETKIKKYFDRQIRDGYAPLNAQLAMMSNINFVKFVTYDVTEDLK